jgi:hypothetical protein
VIYAKRDIELGDEITYGACIVVTAPAIVTHRSCVQIIISLSSKTRFLVFVAPSNVVVISIRLVLNYCSYSFSDTSLLSSLSAPHFVSVLFICLSLHSTP